MCIIIGELKVNYGLQVYYGNLLTIFNWFTFGNLLKTLDILMESAIKTDSKGKKTVLNACTEPCAIEKGMRLIGGKWTGSIIYHLKDEPVRFNDLGRMLGGVSKKMLDQRLKELEANGMVVRKVIHHRPIAVTYELSEFGRSALKILDELRVWSESNNIQ